MDDRVVFTVGELARRTGLPARTIRFWAETGALPPAGRSASGYRLYDAEGLARLELIATLRAGLRAHGWVLAACAPLPDAGIYRSTGLPSSSTRKVVLPRAPRASSWR
jgi:hypothetical protein